MPVIYSSSNKTPGTPLENLACAAANTETDFFFMKPGSSRPINWLALRVQGKGAGLTQLSGISIRMKQWTSSASATSSTATTGQALTPQPKNQKMPSCVATAGLASSTNSGGAVASGTGGVYVGLGSMGASGPGGWVAINPDDVPTLDGNTSMSQDLISASGTSGLLFEFELDHQEGI